VDAHYQGEAQHRISAFHAFCSEWPYTLLLVFCMQYTSDIMNSTISTPFLSQKTDAIFVLAVKEWLNLWLVW
jgi:hypothetical protein